LVAGIPDFRVYPDPYIDLQADREKGLHLAEEATRLNFPDLVAHYYAITPEVPPDRAQAYQAHHLAGLTRGQGILERLKAYRLAVYPGSNTRTLDLGCGTGGFLAVASMTGGEVIGVDIAFRWLVVARRRLEELGCQNVRLVCACADYLPFPDQSFDLVVAENLIEHTKEPASVLVEVSRVRRQVSAFMARTVNRYAAAPEPHVGLWGVGFLPRWMMNNYVRWLKGIPYKHIQLQSYRSLWQLIHNSRQVDLRICCPYLTPFDYQHHSPQKQQLFQWYNRLGTYFPAARPVLTLFGPYLDIVSQSIAYQPPV
jgi:ubiquinone/menaquinone biosynthesis C-methylase UbiE